MVWWREQLVYIYPNSYTPHDRMGEVDGEQGTVALQKLCLNVGHNAAFQRSHQARRENGQRLDMLLYVSINVKSIITKAIF